MPLILPLWQIEIHNEIEYNEQLFFNSILQQQQNIFAISSTHIYNKQNFSKIKYFLTCCHCDIKEHFIRSIKKGNQFCL